MPQQSLLHSPAKVKSVNPLAEKKGKKSSRRKMLKFRLLCASTGWETFLIIKALTPKSVQVSAATIQRLLSSICYQLPATCCLTSLSALSTDSRLLPRSTLLASCSWLLDPGSWRHLMPLTAKSCHHKEVSQKNWRHCKMRIKVISVLKSL